MRSTIKTTLCLMGAIILAGCAASTPVPPTPTPAPLPTATAAPIVTATAASFSDPFAYCAAVTDQDKPDTRYSGEAMPETIVDGLMKATGAAEDARSVVRTASAWRCMDRKVYACWVGANLPCEAQANVDKTPTQAENDFCTANPDSLGIPAFVTGHETIYNWVCKEGKPVIDGQGFHVDPRGFISEIWYAMPQH
jgi:hypothetical protein